MSSCNRRQPGPLARLRLPALIVALVTIGTPPALAQVREATLEELRHELSPGDFISLVQTSGESVTGRLVGFGDSALDIRSEIRQDTGKQRLNITVLSPPSGRWSGLATLRATGCSSGQGSGAGWSWGCSSTQRPWTTTRSTSGPQCIWRWGRSTPVSARSLAGLFDSAHSKPRVRFNAPSAETMRIGVAPLLARRKGMAFVMAF